MSLTIAYRLVMAFLGLLAFVLSTIIATQNTGLSQTVMVWLGVTLSILNFILAGLPSLVRSILPNEVEQATLRAMRQESEGRG